MTFNDDSQLQGGRVKRRGRTAGIAGGGIGLAGIVVFLIAQFTGVDVSGLVSDGGGQTSIGTGSDATPVAGCTTGRDANASVDCRMEGAAESLDAYWTAEAQALGFRYSSPDFFLFDGATSTQCGDATSATGPFYCPPDRAVFLDTAFYQDLQDRYGTSGGPLAQMYVVAHEWGHHVQQLQGTFDGTDRSGTGADSASVRTELQADCYAGAWVGAASTTTDANGTTFFEPVTEAQVADALNAASAVGDDRIQAASGGQVDPDSFTHGTSAERQRWFEQGRTGGAGQCDTFAVAGDEL